MQNYFWIIPTNEIEEDNGSTSPFYFTVYSKNLLDDCIANKKVSPFNLYKEDDWNFDDEYIKLQKGMSEFIYKNRIKIMTIRKRWESGFKEIIKVYITPVKGDFCKCPISDKNGRNINYQGDIYFPIKNITYNNAFELNNINTYLLHKKMKTENVKNNYW